jgi:hypothetical protein
MRRESGAAAGRVLRGRRPGAFCVGASVASVGLPQSSDLQVGVYPWTYRRNRRTDAPRTAPRPRAEALAAQAGPSAAHSRAEARRLTKPARGLWLAVTC